MTLSSQNRHTCLSNSTMVLRGIHRLIIKICTESKMTPHELTKVLNLVNGDAMEELRRIENFCKEGCEKLP